MLRWHEHLDAAWHTGLSTDEACAFEGQNHLVDGRRRNAEAALDIGFGAGLSRLAEELEEEVGNCSGVSPAGLRASIFDRAFGF